MALLIIRRLFTGDYDSFEELETSYLECLHNTGSQQDVLDTLMLPFVLLDSDERVFRRLGFRLERLWTRPYNAKFVMSLRSLLADYLDAQHHLEYIKQMIDHFHGDDAQLTQDPFYLDAIKVLAKFVQEQTDMQLEPSSSDWPTSLLTAIASHDEDVARRILAAIETGCYNCDIRKKSTQTHLERRLKFAPLELVDLVQGL